MKPIPLERLDRFGLILLLVTALVSGYWVFRDIKDTRRQFRIEKDVLSEKLQEVNLAQTNLGDLKSVLRTTSEELAYVNERIPESGKIGLLLQQVDALLRRHDVRRSSIQPLPTVEEKIYVRNPLRLKFEGRFADIYRLLSDIERMNRIVIMDRMIMKNETTKDVCHVDLTANVFERKRNATLQLTKVTQ